MDAATRHALKSPAVAPNSYKTSLLFTIEDGIGALDNVLHVLRQEQISLTRIESRPSQSLLQGYDFFVDFEMSHAGDVQAPIDHLVSKLGQVAKHVKVISMDEKGLAKSHSLSTLIPWFPRRLQDLDTFADKVLEAGSDLTADHPGFSDQVYRTRRNEITAIARTYRTGQPIPYIQYTDMELQTWSTVFTKLTQLFPTHACREHQFVFPLLIQNCGYRADNIPQLEDISRFLRDCTGFTLRPVMGLLTSRDFLNGLAFRVFHSTQYIRHHSTPFYTPEPDVCHELLGHVPLFADPDFAAFSQEIGLASLGASDEDIEKLATIYWFTVEFGLCRQGDEIRAYGAGLLSSFGELEYCLSGKPELRPFDPNKTAATKYPITQFQPVYYVADSFKSAQEKVREFAANMQRPFTVRYNPYTQSIEVLDSKEKLVRYVSSIAGDLHNLLDALKKL